MRETPEGEEGGPTYHIGPEELGQAAVEAEGCPMMNGVIAGEAAGSVPWLGVTEGAHATYSTARAQFVHLPTAQQQLQPQQANQQVQPQQAAPQQQAGSAFANEEGGCMRQFVEAPTAEYSPPDEMHP